MYNYVCMSVNYLLGIARLLLAIAMVISLVDYVDITPVGLPMEKRRNSAPNIESDAIKQKSTTHIKQTLKCEI